MFGNTKNKAKTMFENTKTMGFIYAVGCSNIFTRMLFCLPTVGNSC